MRFIAERLPAPLMTFAPPDGFSTFPISKAEMAKMGYRPRRILGHGLRRHGEGGAAVL
jgi:hypothetical protein